MGKKANCQVAPSVHYVSPTGHYPLAMRLFLPDCWTGDKARLDKAGVPEAFRQAKTKGAIALELLDQVRGEGLPGWLVAGQVEEASRYGRRLYDTIFNANARVLNHIAWLIVEHHPGPSRPDLDLADQGQRAGKCHHAG